MLVAAARHRMPENPPLRPGFVVLHGNRIEDLASVALDWLARHPLGPLDEETLLVPSSGMAEWLKAAMATQLGVAAGFRIELPAQFTWRAWRAVLGAGAVPAASPLDKGPLTWWLMRRLPDLARQPAFAPLAGFLAMDPSPLRRLELARRLADLFDQYQVYRPDWLDDWAAGRDRLRREPGEPGAEGLPAGQAWQAALWRALLAELAGEPGAGRRPADATAPAAAPRPVLHRRFIAALRARPEASPPPGLPPRLLLFGTTHLPHTTLEALGELSRHIPVLLAVPDPSSHPWAQLPSDDPTAHPLLQAWGRQGRDFLRQLAAWDSGRERAEQLGLRRTDLFDEAEPRTALQHLQARIRELSPPPPPDRPLPWPQGDRSLVFHQAHGPLREVELLHDQLLDALARGDFEARDVVVMVPDIERFAPAIAAVFGRFAPGEPRHIPWGLADRRERGRHPLLRTLEALLQVRERRWTHSELRDWLATPAVATRWGLDEAAIEQLGTWLAGAGLRWGLHAAQRAALGLQAAGAIGSARFALDRLLLGYATGELPPGAGPLGAGLGLGDDQGLDPWPEVAGVDAARAGTLAEALAQLDSWWAEAAEPRAPGAWLPVLRTLLTAMFSASDEREKNLLALLDDSLQAWVATCEAAGFAEPVGLDLVREAWLAGVDEAGGGRFRAGGVTFCTLLPLRAIPFRCVCLLGMNDGDYPRPASRSDFDLLANPLLARAGDRSRRDDDRQLMLDALLAARDRLHISWSAHRARDNQAQPPSVLVQQLRDHVATLWGPTVLEAITVAHPLQPFSRAYIELPREGEEERLFTHAHEWRRLHEPAPDTGAVPAAAPAAPAAFPGVLPLKLLADFVRRPVEAFFRQRLRADLALHDEAQADDEPFAAAGLEAWQWREQILRGGGGDAEVASQQLAPAVARLRREGRLPWGGPGEAVAQGLQAEMAPVLAAWAAWQAAHSAPAAAPAGERVSVSLTMPGSPQPLRIDAGLLPWRLDAAGRPQRLHVSASRVSEGRSPARPRPDKLVGPWLEQLVLAASGQPCGLCVIGTDSILRAAAVPEAEARARLTALAAAWWAGTGPGGPWPTALATGLAWLAGRDARAVFESGSRRRGDDQEPHLARLYPRWADLMAEPRFEAATTMLYAPLAAWLATVSVEALPDAVAAADDEDTADD
jgi:exodeoxyribonuclease V gamma subunit